MNNAPIEDEPVEEKNWNDLPVELKRMCIQPMDFKTRTLLRSTSKRERVIVDSVKQIIDHLVLDFRPKETTFCVSFIPRKEPSDYFGVKFDEEKEGYRARTDLSTEAKKFDRVLQFLKVVLERSVIHRFNVGIETEMNSNLRDVELLRTMVEEGPLIRTSRLDIGLPPNSIIQMAILKKCDASLKVVYMGILKHMDVEETEEFFNISQLVNAEKICMRNSRMTSTTNEFTAFTFLMNKWLSGDAAVGKEISLLCILRSTFLEMEADFSGKIIRKTEDNNAIRIRAENAQKHLWVRRSTDHLLQCLVVDADSADPDFKKIDEERIEEYFEKEEAEMEPLFLNPDGVQDWLIEWDGHDYYDSGEDDFSWQIIDNTDPLGEWD